MQRVIFFLMVVGAALVAVVITSRSRQAHPVIPWRSDFNSASAEARETHKPILLDFWATWCGPCQEMRRTTWSDPKVAAALKDYVPVEVDVDANGPLAQRFGVHAIPHLVLLSPDGQEIRSSDGLLSSDQFVGWLTEPQVIR